MNKENKIKLETLLKKVAKVRDLEICSLKIQTNQNPMVLEIIIKKTNGDDISLDDCALFNAKTLVFSEKFTKQKQTIMNIWIKLINLILRNFIYLTIFEFFK